MTKEWAQFRHDAASDVGLLHAHYVQHAYPRHSHDYYVVCLIERGRQSFMHRGSTYSTPAGGVILINPGAVHTGEAVDGKGFELRSLYPTVDHMERAVYELTGRHQGLPFFKEVRVDHQSSMNSLLSLHKAMSEEAGALECESRFLWTLAHLIKRYADIRFNEGSLGDEQTTILRVRRYMDENFAQRITLDDLARHVNLSPYYLLRAFRAEVGMPPHTYLESVRVREAQKRIEAGKPLAEVALEVGFSSQSHLTRHFKKIIGATPGRYALQAGAR